MFRHFFLIGVSVLSGLYAADEAATVTGLAAPAGKSHIAELFGFSMWPLWVAALVLIYFIINRVKALKATIVLDADVTQNSIASLEQLDVRGALAAIEGDSVQALAFQKGLRDFTLGGVTLQEALTNAAMNAFRPLYKNIQGISTISSIAPLLGLLGTIIGMIMVFNDLSRSASPDKSQLAEGIMVALFTTAAGLIVAIPGIVCGRWLNAKITRYAQQMEDDIDDVCFAFHSALREAGAGGEDFTVDALRGLSPAEPAPARPTAAPARPAGVQRAPSPA